ncbi:MAG: hypothetical protein SYR96_25740, partial [Actinomycetota bacterium]|nr:hypothetical protein [Actinomycetota bacterium]
QARDLVGLAAGVAAGAWPRRDGFELRGKTLGIIGRGAVAHTSALIGSLAISAPSTPSSRDTSSAAVLEPRKGLCRVVWPSPVRYVSTSSPGLR